jgi:hypothetical protein
MELPDDFKSFMLNDDDTYKVYIKESLQRMENVFGNINAKYGLGTVSQEILNKINTETIQKSEMNEFN